MNMKYIKCPYCGVTLEVPESAFGGNIRCCDCNCKFSWDNTGITLVEFPHREEVVGIEEELVVLPTEDRKRITFETIKRTAIRLFWPKGRATRHDFFSRYLCFFLLSLYFVPVTFAVIANMEESPLSCLWLFILIPFALAAFWGEAVVCVQRVNDIGWPGWAGAVYSVLGNVLMRVVGLRFIGPLFIVFFIGLIVIGSIRGTVGPNQYGDDPKGQGKNKKRVRFSFLRVGLGLIIIPVIAGTLIYCGRKLIKESGQATGIGASGQLNKQVYLANKAWYQQQLRYHDWEEEYFIVQQKDVVLSILGREYSSFAIHWVRDIDQIYYPKEMAPGFAKELMMRRYEIFKYENGVR